MVEMFFGTMLLVFCLMSGVLGYRVMYQEAQTRKENGW
jgi:hypothetical protein